MNNLFYKINFTLASLMVALAGFALSQEAQAQDTGASFYGSSIQANFLAQRQYARRYTDGSCLRQRALSTEELFQSDEDYQHLEDYCQWTRVWGQVLEKKEKGGYPAFTEKTPINVMLGHEIRVHPDVNLALMGGYSFVQHDMAHSGNVDTTAEGHRVHLAFVTNYQNYQYKKGEGLRASLALGGGYVKYNLERKTGQMMTESEPELLNYGAYGSVSYLMRNSDTLFEPRILVDVTRIHLVALEEFGGANPLKVTSDDELFVSVSAALHMEARFEGANQYYDPYIDIGFTYVIENDIKTQGRTKASSPAPFTRRDEVDKFFINYDIGFSWKIYGEIFAYASYEGMFAPDGETTRHGGRFGLNY